MKKTLWTKIVLLVTVLIFSPVLKAQTARAEEGSGATTVTVSAKVAEDITVTPGMVKVWMDNDIEKLGFYTLSDLARLTAGYGVLADFGLLGYEVRGANPNAVNNSSVYTMINGIPINSVETNRAWLEEELPLYFAKQVEFLRGPSSALYGSGAALGAVNIIPKVTKQNGSHSSLMLTGGNPDEVKRALSYTSVKNEFIELSISGNVYKKDASRELYEDVGYMLGLVPAPHYSHVQDNVEANFLYASMKVVDAQSALMGLESGLIYLRRRGGLHEGVSGVTNNAEYLTFEEIIPFLKLTKKVDENITFNGEVHTQFYKRQLYYLFCDEHRYKRIYPYGFALLDTVAARKAQMVYTDLSLIYEKDSLNVIGGFAYDHRKLLGYPDSYSYSSTDTGLAVNTTYDRSPFADTGSGYLQIKYLFPVLKGLQTTAGGRYDKGNAVEGVVSPTVSLAQKLTDALIAKILYGRGVTAPTIEEKVLRRDFTIASQKTDTLEASGVYTTKLFQTSLTYFKTATKDSLVTDENSLIVNASGTRKSAGVELDVDMPLKTGKLFFNSTLQRSEDENGKDVANIPQQKFNVGIIMNVPRTGTDVALVGRFLGDYTNRTGLTDPHILEVRGDKAKNVTLFDVNIIRKSILKAMDLELQVRNLLNKEYTLPSSRTDVPFDNNQVGRTILVSLKGTF